MVFYSIYTYSQKENHESGVIKVLSHLILLNDVPFDSQ
jgi:hypothetical protein